MSRLQLFVNGQEVEGIKSEVVLTLGVNNLRDISTRNGNYTNTFEVPRTNTNRLIFGSPEIVQSGGTQVYSKLPAEQVVDGITFDGFITFQESGENFRLNFFSGNSDFNNSIKSMDLEDLEAELEYLNHDWTHNEVMFRRDAKSGIVYPNIDYGFFEKFSGSPQRTPWKWFRPAVYVNDLINAAVKKLGYKLSGACWLASTYLNRAIPCTDIVQGNTEDGGGVSYNASFPFNTYTEVSGRYIPFPTRESDELLLYTEMNIPTRGILKVYRFNAPVSATTAFKLELFGGIDQDYPRLFGVGGTIILRLDVLDKNTGAFVTSIYARIFNSSAEGTNTFIVNDIATDLSNIDLIDWENHVLVWFLKNEVYNGGVYAHDETLARVRFNNLQFTFTQYIQGSNANTIQFTSSLPSLKLGELFKAICNLEGIFTIVDENERTIKGYYYDDIRKNVGRAYDWSDLVDLSDQPKIQYRFNEYGQMNKFLYEQDEADLNIKVKPPNFESGNLLVADTNLAEVVELVKIPFGTVAIDPTFNGLYAFGKIYTGEKYTFDGTRYLLNPGASVGKFDKRMVTLTDSTAQVYTTNFVNVIRVISGNPGKVIIDNASPLFETNVIWFNNTNGNQVSGGVSINDISFTIVSRTDDELTLDDEITGTIEATSGVIVTTALSTKKSRDCTSMDWKQIIKNRYGLINDVLTRTKIVNALFRLRVNDIYNLDFSRPVYVDLFSEYFYINQIKQFKLTSQASTEVELVRI
jgi:hypothetical protein